MDDDDETDSLIELQERGDAAMARQLQAGPGGQTEQERDDAAMARRLRAESGGQPQPFSDDSVHTDMQFAMMMQQMEMATAVPAVGEEPDNVGFVDPVWGKLELAEGQTTPSPSQVLCFSLCPCCVGSLASAAKREAVQKVLRTWSFALAVLQTVLLLWSCYLSGGLAPRSVNPMLGPTADALDVLGARNTARIVYEWQVHRLLTPSLLHAGFIHLAMNVTMQLRIGLYLELQWGASKWLCVYFASGVGSALLSSVFLPDQLGVGASGSLMGLLGAYLIELQCHWDEGDASEKEQRQFQLVMVFVNCLVVLGFSFTPMIDWAAHLGGMVVGALVGGMLWGRDLPGEKGRRIWRLGAWGLGLYVLICCSAIILFVRPNEGLLEICASVKRSLPKHVCA